MEILILALLYCLSQNPNFSESVKPLMGQLKNSEQMLAFLNDLSRFTQTFSTFQSAAQTKQTDCKDESNSSKSTQSNQTEKSEEREKKDPQSPTQGIADEFIQQMLEGYLKRR